MHIKLNKYVAKSILGVATFVLSIPALSAMDNTYQEAGGLVVMETENTMSPLGQWIRIEPGDANYVAGATGGAHLEFTGNTFNGGPPNSPLVYKFKVNQGGNYYLNIRARKRLEGLPGDKSNDAYVRMEGDFTSGSTFYPTSTLTQDTKLFGGLENTWGWATDLDGNGAPHKPAIYNLKAGETYTFTVSGRSIRFNIDRIIFRHSSVTNAAARNPNVPESGLVAVNSNHLVDFQFNTQADTEGWTRNEHTSGHAITAQGEYLVRAAPGAIDPQIRHENLSFSGSDASQIQVRFKSEESGDLQFFWGTSQAPGFSASRMFTAPYPTAGEDVEFVFDLSNEPEWIGKTITSMRFDIPTSAAGPHSWFDYIVSTTPSPHVWNMDSADEVAFSNITATVSGGLFNGQSSGNLVDPFCFVKQNGSNILNIDADQYDRLRMRVFLGNNIPVAPFVIFFWKGDSFYTKSLPGNAVSGWHIYDVDLNQFPEWNGTVTRFRLDFVQGFNVPYDIQIDYIGIEN